VDGEEEENWAKGYVGRDGASRQCYTSSNLLFLAMKSLATITVTTVGRMIVKAEQILRHHSLVSISIDAKSVDQTGVRHPILLPSSW
jgi:hypothetical protein